MYSAAIVETAISVCNLETQWTGQVPTIKTHPVWDFMHKGSSGSSASHYPAKSEFTKQSTVSCWKERES